MIFSLIRFLAFSLTRRFSEETNVVHFYECAYNELSQEGTTPGRNNFLKSQTRLRSILPIRTSYRPSLAQKEGDMLDWVLNLTTAFGLSTSAGLNAYIPLLTVALLSRFTDLITLEEPWSALTNGWIIGLLAVLLIVDALADKIPAVDSVNDVIGTVIRPTAGAILFAATTQHTLNLSPILALGCGVILAGGVHAVKASARPVITATTAGAGNSVVSSLEEAVSAITAVLAVLFPYLVLLWIFLIVLLLYLIVRRRRLRAAAHKAAPATDAATYEEF